MANLFTRINRGIRAGVRAARSAPNYKALSDRLDQMIQNDELPTEEKAIRELSNPSKLEIRKSEKDIAFASAFRSLRMVLHRKDAKALPGYGTIDRDVFLSEFWMREPILAGAVYSMTAKMSALKWSVTGPRLQSLKAARIFAGAAHMGGYDWGGFISPTANDFYTTNNGVFWETPKDGNPVYGKLAALGHIDSLTCTLTGNVKAPMIYVSDTTGQVVKFRDGEYIHFSSLPSPREQHLGIGFCAVDRVYRAAKLLMGLHDYDEEKLSNLPPEGVASVTGMTMEEFLDAISLWQTHRKQDNSLTFPQVLWLIGSQPGAEVKVDIQSFSQIPESFDRNSVVTHYISTLALGFGVDAREFWPISSGSLGTASESEIQHIKAKGKGPGEFISDVERHLNGELPEGVDFKFDTQDIEEDMTAAAVAKAWVDVFYPLYQGSPKGRNKETQFEKPKKEGLQNEQQPKEQAGMPGNFGAPTVEQVIDRDELIRLLSDKGVLPDYMINDSRVAVSDNEIHIGTKSRDADYDDAKFVWDGRVLKEVRLPPIIIHSEPVHPIQEPIQDIPVAELGKESKPEISDLQAAFRLLQKKERELFDIERDIKGDPIPEAEVTRGARITPKTIRDEIERWKKHPVLSKYVPNDEELATENGNNARP